MEKAGVVVPAGSITFFKVLAFADAYDYLLLFSGTVGAAIHGCCLPMFLFYFGKLLHGFGVNENNPAKSAEIVSQNALHLFYASFAAGIASWAGMAVLNPTMISNYHHTLLANVSFLTDYFERTGERQAARIRVRYLQAVLKQDASAFDAGTCSTGDVVSSLASDTLHIQDAIGEKMGNFIHYTCTFISGFAVAFTAIWKLSLVTLAVLPALAFVGGLYHAVLTGINSKAQEVYAEAGKVAEQTISQVRTVYAFVGEEKAEEAYSKCLQKSVKLGCRAGVTAGVGIGALHAVVNACWALLFWYAGVLVRRGEANGGESVSTIFTVTSAALALGQAMMNVTSFSQAKASASRIFAVIDREATERPTSKLELDSVRGHIEFRNVDFNYPSRPDAVVLRNFSLSIPATKSVAVVGSSGAGKSTVISLIERFYDPTRGEVLLDGVNIQSLSLKWLREQIGLVSQEPVLFATTIKENLLYGKPDATQEEIEKACVSAHAHTFISKFPDSYNTQVGERGVQLSTGQKQRIAIARAILRNPRVLLLDEATSALDATSARLVQRALAHVTVGRTTVVVAHQLSAVRSADLIAVVQDGAVKELGRHESLLERNGAYSALYQLQGIRVDNTADLLVVPEDDSETSLDVKLENSQRHDPYVVAKAVSPTWRLVKMNRPEWRYGAAGALGSILAGLVHPSFALITSNVLFTYYDTDLDKMRETISRNALALAIVAGCALLGQVVQHYCFGVMGENLLKRVRELMLCSILKKEVSWFDRDENNSSQVCTRLSADATAVQSATGSRISLLIQTFTSMLAACAIVFMFQWKMAAVVLATVPLILFGVICEKIVLKGFSSDVESAHARSGMIAGEAVRNIRTVAAFNAQESILSLFQHELTKPLKRGVWRGQVAGISYGISQFCLYAAVALSMWYGGQVILNHEAGFDSVIKASLVLIISTFAIVDTIALMPDLLKGSRALTSIFALLDDSRVAKPAATTISPDVRGDIQFQNVWFAYPTRPENPIFTNLNLHVPAGSSLALVGPSGAGKSSVLALLERFYDPTSGHVLLDGRDVQSLDVKSLRRRIALVSQEPALFATTILENILYGASGASVTEQEVQAAAAAANAHGFISALPDGYHTVVGEGGGTLLSGGQRQRIAIARAVLRRPALLLLDEATSALDAASEALVQGALHSLMQGRTSVVVAHRLSTIWNVDCIAVIQDGKVVEFGSHKKLLAKVGGIYSHLVFLQNPHGASFKS